MKSTYVLPTTANPHSNSIGQPGGYAPVTLLVDDDALSLDLLSAHMAGLGARQVHCATDGRLALRTLEGMQRPPDLIICDVFMPDMDGFEFLEQLTARNFAGDVIVISGGNAHLLELSELIGKTGGLRVLATLTKPVAQQQLAQVLRSATQSA